MKITKLARRSAKELLGACFAEGRLQEDRVRTVVHWVVKGKPRGYLAILTHFERLVCLEVQRRTARVETAIATDADLQASVQQSLSRLYGKGLTISFNVNESLIGGMRVTVGSDVLDGTIRGRLFALADRF